MSTAPAKKIRVMPKGGRKGGTSFPRIALVDALGYAKKLVTKTHTGPQPQDVIFSGVVGAKSGKGQVRIGALKQYGLIKGDAKTNYAAEELAKQINAAPPDELPPLYQRVALRPAVFKNIFDAFLGDSVTKAKLRQRASDLKVHPDETAACVDLYISTMTTAGLVTVDGENVTHIAPIATGVKVGEAADTGASIESADDEGSSREGEESGGDAENDAWQHKAVTGNRGARGPRAVFNVNVSLDSSLDIEKLQKQLELLRRFGAI
jgi:hypothetical protein